MTGLLVRSVYALVGAVFLLGGTTVLLLGTGLLPGPVQDAVRSAGENNDHTLHLMQEYATLLVLVALLTFWFVKHYEDSRAFHWCMTAFWGLIALIHWFDTNGRFHHGLGEALNSIPFVVFVLLGLLREKAAGRTGPVAPRQDGQSPGNASH